MPKYITKYIPGRIIRTIRDFEFWSRCGGWIYWYGRPKHPSVLIHQQYKTLIGLINHKMLRRAILNPERKGEKS